MESNIIHQLLKNFINLFTTFLLLNLIRVIHVDFRILNWFYFFHRDFNLLRLTYFIIELSAKMNLNKHFFILRVLHFYLLFFYFYKEKFKIYNQEIIYFS